MESGWSRLNKAKIQLLDEGKSFADYTMINPKESPPRAALDRLLEAINLEGAHKYSSSRGLKTLREAFSLKYKTKFSVDLDANTDVCVCFGSKDGLAQTLRCLSKKGDKILIPKPYYPTHFFTASQMCLDISTFDLGENEEETLNNLLEKCAKVQPHIVLLNFPNNPTGQLMGAGFYSKSVSYTHLTLPTICSV